MGLKYVKMRHPCNNKILIAGTEDAMRLFRETLHTENYLGKKVPFSFHQTVPGDFQNWGTNSDAKNVIIKNMGIGEYGPPKSTGFGIYFSRYVHTIKKDSHQKYFRKHATISWWLLSKEVRDIFNRIAQETHEMNMLEEQCNNQPTIEYSSSDLDRIVITCITERGAPITWAKNCMKRFPGLEIVIGFIGLNFFGDWCIEGTNVMQFVGYHDYNFNSICTKFGILPVQWVKLYTSYGFTLKAKDNQNTTLEFKCQ